jgi:formamidopyrimidine-DNA glycosylase
VPELPEAETIIRSLRRQVEGKRIVAVDFRAKRVSKDDPAQLAGRRVESLGRYGKQILFELDEGYLLVKLGMTGRLLWGSEPTQYTRALMEFEHGHVCFDDIRQFGSMNVLGEPPSAYGPDPFEIGPSEFAARLRAHDTEVKKLLLDQHFIRGVGNIYADEALFRAGVHPRRRTRRMRADSACGLHATIVEVLETAISQRGSSISDYVDAAGERGNYQQAHQVYGREGEPCPQCGAPIRRIVVGQRSAHFCSRCQRR